MIARVLTALIGIPVAVLLIFWPGGLPFAIAIGIVSILGTGELYTGARKAGARPVEWAGLVAAAMFVASARNYERGSISAVFPMVLTSLVIVSLLSELLRTRRSPLTNVGATLFGPIYVGWLLSHIVALRSVPGEIAIGSHKSTAGAWLVMYTFLCTWACDTGAYFVGKFYGKTRFAPKLSPGKTIEGSVAGLVSTVLISVIVGILINLPPVHSFSLGAILGVLCQLGDLSESAIKREIGIKDFGTIVPGHGGILDRFDSLLFAAPAAYYYAVLSLQNWPK